MLYCPDCGAQNEDDADFCIKCGAPLREGVRRTYRRDEWDEKDERREKQEKQEKDEKQEKSEGDARNWGLLIGFLILASGLISLAEDWWGYAWDNLWPFLIIIVGLFFVYNGLKARQRSPRP